MIVWMAKIIAWWKGLSGWKKWLGSTVFIVVATLWVASLIMDRGSNNPPPMKPIDDHEREKTDEAIAALAAKDEEYQQQIRDKKEAIIIKLNQAGKIDATTVARRKQIMDAEGDELDRLQKEFDL